MTPAQTGLAYVAMVLFDVAHDPLPSGEWAVLRNGHVVGRLESKSQAIAFAMREAKRLELEPGTNVLIHIEGADGAWRVFNASMSAPIPAAGASGGHAGNRK